MDKGSKNIRTVVFSLIAVLLVFNALVWINVFSSALSLRMDFTADKLYTLSPGTRGILTELPLEQNEKVQIRYYCSKGKVEMPVFLKSFSRRVDDLLEELEQIADGKLEVERLNPLPTNNHEEKAGIDGVEGQMTQTGEVIYLGIAISFFDIGDPATALINSKAPLNGRLHTDFCATLRQLRRIGLYTCGAHHHADIGHDGSNDKGGNLGVEQQSTTAHAAGTHYRHFAIDIEAAVGQQNTDEQPQRQHHLQKTGKAVQHNKKQHIGREIARRHLCKVLYKPPAHNDCQQR